MKVTRISGSLGAEITGCTLSNSREIRQAWLEHKVLFFRDTDLSPRRFVLFAKQFGAVLEYPNNLLGFPEILPIIKLENETINIGGVWHTDGTFLKNPPMGSLLIAREVPPYGGDTLFADTTLAYAALSIGMQRILEPLSTVNEKNGQRAHQRVVREHPETGALGLYVSESHAKRFSGMTAEESAPLLNFLFRHMTKPEFTCRFSWRKNSIAFWDNRCTLHCAVNDYQGHRRIMHRITLK